MCIYYTIISNNSISGYFIPNLTCINQLCFRVILIHFSEFYYHSQDTGPNIRHDFQVIIAVYTLDHSVFLINNCKEFLRQETTTMLLNYVLPTKERSLMDKSILLSIITLQPVLRVNFFKLIHSFLAGLSPLIFS